MARFSATLCLISIAVAACAAPASAFWSAEDQGTTDVDALISGIGNGLWHSAGLYLTFPVNASEAKAEGWYQIDDCDESIGTRWSNDKSGPGKYHPAELLFTAAGQFAGMRVFIYGSSSTSSIGNAAQPQLIKEGFWIPVEGESDTWYITMNTRPAGNLCSGEASPSLLGTQIVLNQDTGLNFEVPLSAMAAKSQGYAAGACIEGMGQHWELDLTMRNGSMSWIAGNMMPVVPMYWPPTIDGTIHAIFFATPVAQPGAVLLGHGDWDTPAITASLMCDNFCLPNCHWDTKMWSTMHVYFNSDWKTAKCPGGSGFGGRSCPKD